MSKFSHDTYADNAADDSRAMTMSSKTAELKMEFMIFCYEL